MAEWRWWEGCCRLSFEAVEFIGRLVSHIPGEGQVLQRSCGAYANRTRRVRRKMSPRLVGSVGFTPREAQDRAR